MTADTQPRYTTARLRREQQEARRKALEDAAQFIERHMLCEDRNGNEVLAKRSNHGNKVGLAYAAGIRAMKDKIDG